MTEVNAYNVLYGNPTKKLILAREKMKEDFNKDSAKVYLEAYVGTPLSFILENSRMIFSEPYYGYDFYKKVITESSCIFPFYENELEKVRSFIESAEGMSDLQREKYIELESILEEKVLDHRNSAMIYEYAVENGADENFILELADSIYQLKNFANFNETTEESDELRDNILSMMENVEDQPLFIAIGPYVYEAMRNTDALASMYDYMPTTFESAYDWEVGAKSILLVGKASEDPSYRKAVSSINNPMMRATYESYMETDLRAVLESMSKTEVSHDDIPPVYETGSSAVNGLFDNEVYFENMEDTDSISRDDREHIINEINTMAEGLAYTEYTMADDVDSPIMGYDFFPEGTTVEEALTSFFEDSVPVVPNNKKPNTNPVNPKKEEDFTTRIQNKAMDIEAKQTEKLAEGKRKAGNLRNAAKAITNIPKNIIDSIKNVGKSWNDADERRRKKYMTEPGFRKKIFRNVKLALTYGALGSIKLIFVPYFAIIRHFSKEKDRRVRNELVREIQTELNITNEKINDANANNDQKQKYELMRIKSQLEAELVRVKLNSKYV